jgi:hypothetical protein
MDSMDIVDVGYRVTIAYFIVVGLMFLSIMAAETISQFAPQSLAQCEAERELAVEELERLKENQ